MKTIIDLVLVAILIICAWTGYKKGIIMGIGGILVIILSIYGANLLSGAFSSGAVPVMKPFVTGFIEGKMVTKQGSDVLGILDSLNVDTSSTSLEDLIRADPSLETTVAVGTFEALGITENTAKDMSSDVSAAYEKNGGAFTDAITLVLCNRLAFVVTFILAFLIILIFLTVIGNITNLSFKIPNLDIVNDIVGTLLGIVTGLIFCTILVWALKYSGLIIGGDTVSKTVIAKSFMGADRLTKILGY
ncbi:MAG: CvpA family protein [Firmicutes bacterium]|nr:CvpA family protein [Bacillota bacterium]